MSTDFILARIEAILFTADRPLAGADLHSLVADPLVSAANVEQALARLAARHPAAPDRGFALWEAQGRYQLRSTPPVAPLLRRVAGKKPHKLSRAATEVLAIVAWKQPCTRSDVERIRAVDCGPILRGLLDRRLVRIAGRRDEPGRPAAYATTPEFLRVLGLGTLDELPALREFTALGPEDLAELAALGEDGTEPKQVTLAEYATQRARAALDARVEAHLRGDQEPDQE